MAFDVECTGSVSIDHQDPAYRVVVLIVGKFVVAVLIIINTSAILLPFFKLPLKFAPIFHGVVLGEP